jgi:hypothetical protein
MHTPDRTMPALRGCEMRLSLRDGVATVCSVAAVTLYVLWLPDHHILGLSGTRAAGVIVFALGFVACSADRRGLMNVFGAGDRSLRVSMTYRIVAASAGAIALVAAIGAIALRSQPMLATLVAAIVVLWLMSTARHAVGAPSHA